MLQALLGALLLFTPQDPSKFDIELSSGKPANVVIKGLKTELTIRAPSSNFHHLQESNAGLLAEAKLQLLPGPSTPSYAGDNPGWCLSRLRS